MATSRQINSRRKAEGKPPLNFTLFRKVIKKLETAPNAYEQITFGERDREAPCGTAACIAGWAAIEAGRIKLHQIKRLQIHASEIAQSELGITDDESLIFTAKPSSNYEGWPEPYKTEWSKANGRRQQARVAIRYLTHIIKTGKILE
jgi:hypothetical protein